MRWVVGPADGKTVRDVLAVAAADGDAVREGRVFVGRRRVRRDDEPVRGGDVVEVAPPKGEAAAGAIARVLVATSDLVAVDKPAGVPTIPDHAGSVHSLLAMTARALGCASSALHPTSRLDRDVSGVVFFALTRAAAHRLAAARAAGAYVRRYVALAASAPATDRGAWDAPIGRAVDPRRRAVGGRDAVDALTRFAVCGRSPAGPVLLAVAPVTGRTHQIRVHAAHAASPLLGDRAYGGPPRTTLASGRVVGLDRVGLHAARVTAPGSDGAALDVTSPVPAALAELWSALGGDPDCWERAASCALP